ncbi:hypothetical protein [Nocardioides sp.]|uniref:hypothetical protein n=1 Tax=Nocardioides sp. TaxID=35761 RepID=UPI002BE22CDE|nr:hypothetical protein [Nocardioides sp.]HSX67426.1 hypothetical protein [Nocardioides sp.]
MSTTSFGQRWAASSWVERSRMISWSGALAAYTGCMVIAIVLLYADDRSWAPLPFWFAPVVNPVALAALIRGWVHSSVSWMSLGALLAFCGCFLPWYLPLPA